MPNRSELYIRRLFLFFIGTSLILGGLFGNVGSLLAALIDTDHVQEGPSREEILPSLAPGMPAVTPSGLSTGR